MFNETVTNARIYGLLVRSLIRAAVDGFNGTAFAYGQTSSGKTFTMNGSGADPGIIPLAVRDIFDTAAEVIAYSTRSISFLSASCRNSPPMYVTIMEKHSSTKTGCATSTCQGLIHEVE